MKKIFPQILFVLIFSLFYLLIFYYPILELGKLLNIYYNLKFQTIALVLLISPLLIRLLSEKIDNSFFRFTRTVIMFYLGFCFVLLTSLIFFKIINYFVKLDLYVLGIIIFIWVVLFSTLGYVNANLLKNFTMSLDVIEIDTIFLKLSGSKNVFSILSNFNSLVISSKP